MKTLPWLVFGLCSLVPVSGCQHAATPSPATSQQFFNSVKASSPQEEQAVRRAHYHSLVGCFDLALKELSQALASDPHNVRLLNATGNCYDKLGQYAKAQEMYEAILTQEPNNSPAGNNLAYSYYLSGDLAGAEKKFQEILAKNPDDALLLNNLGLVWCRQGKETQALNLWQKNDGEIQAREKLSQVLAYLGKSGDQTAAKIFGNHIKPRQTPEVPSELSEKPNTTAPPAAISQRGKKPVADPSSQLAAADIQPTSEKISHPASSPGKSPAKSQLHVEEVKMIIHPASHSQTHPGDTAARESTRLLTESSLPPGKTAVGITCQPLAKKSAPAEDLCQDEVETPNQQPYVHRPRQWKRYWKPRIVHCNPQEPQKTAPPIKNYLTDQSSYQNQNASSRPEAVFY